MSELVESMTFVAGDTFIAILRDESDQKEAVLIKFKSKVTDESPDE